MDKNSEEYKEKSKERLLKIVDQKIQTAFIGALAQIEERFPELQNDKRWFDARNAILTNGNAQKRAVHAELEQYEVRWNRFSYQFRIEKEQG